MKAILGDLIVRQFNFSTPALEAIAMAHRGVIPKVDGLGRLANEIQKRKNKNITPIYAERWYAFDREVLKIVRGPFENYAQAKAFVDRKFRNKKAVYAMKGTRLLEFYGDLFKPKEEEA